MSDQRRLLEAWAFVVLGLAIAAFAGGLLGEPTTAAVGVEPHRIDANRAGIAELTVLPGIGRARAEAIVLWRVRHGPLRGPADLECVEGFGAATVAGLQPFLCFGSLPPVR